MSNLDIAWAAGFFDGEGNITFTKVGDRRYPMLRVTQVREQPLIKLQDLFGGTINPNKQGYLQWRLYGTKRVRNALSLMSRHLTCKLPEAELTIELCDRIGSSGRTNLGLTDEELSIRQSLINGIRVLRKLGSVGAKNG